MRRSPCCSDEASLKKGPWTPEEDNKLMEYIEKHGQGSWRRLPKLAGLNRCGKSFRLRWTNYLRPDIRKGKFSEDEEQLIVHLHSFLGNKWSAIATRLPGRTGNEIKNYWNTHLRKKLLSVGIDPVTHRPRMDLSLLASIPNLLLATKLGSTLQLPPDGAAGQLARLRLLQDLMQMICSTGCSPTASMDASNMLASANSNQQVSDHGAAAGLSIPSEEILGGQQEIIGASCMNSGDNHIPMPSLVSSSPANSSVDQKQPPSASQVVSPPFEPWCELNLDDLDCDLSWKDILDKLS